MTTHLEDITDTLTLHVLDALGMEDDATEALRTAQEAGEHGADAGFPGFTYYCDTLEFAKNERRHIVAALRDDRDSFGCDTVAEMLVCWKSLKGYTIGDLDDAFSNYAAGYRIESEALDALMNALAWYSLERAGHMLEGVEP